MNGGRQVVLHFGLPKTGTTTVQNQFHRHRHRLLADNGVLYPSLAANLTTPLCTMFLDDPLAHVANRIAGLTAATAAREATRFRTALEEEIRGASWQTLLLSAEGVSNWSQGPLQKLRSWIEQFASDVTVVICVREPLDYTRSVIQQLMKGGETLDALYRDLPLPRFAYKITNAADVFGRHRLVVFDMQAAVAGPGGMVGYFADLLRLQPEMKQLLCDRVRRDNQSLSHEAVLVLDSLNRRLPMFSAMGASQRRSGRDLALINALAFSATPFRLPAPVCRQVLAESRADSEWLRSQFGIDYCQAANDCLEAQSRPTISGATADALAQVVASLIPPSG